MNAAGCRRHCRSRRPPRPARTARSARPRRPGTAAGTTRCRARVAPAAAHDPHVVRVPVADRAPGRRTAWPAVRRRQRAAARRPAAMHRAGGVDLVGAQPQHGRARDLDAVARAASPSSHCTLRPGRIVRTRSVQRRERHRPQQLDGEPRDERRGPGIVRARTRARTARSARHRAARSDPTARAPSGVGTYRSPSRSNSAPYSRSGRRARRIVGRGARCAACHAAAGAPR